MKIKMIRWCTPLAVLTATMLVAACGSPVPPAGTKQSPSGGTSNTVTQQSSASTQLQTDEQTYAQTVQPTVNEAFQAYTKFLNATLQYYQRQITRSDYFYSVHNCEGTIMNDALEIHDLQVSPDVQNYNSLLFTSFSSLDNALQQIYDDQNDSPDQNTQQETLDFQSFSTGFKQFEKDINFSLDPNVRSQVNQALQQLQQLSQTQK